MAGTFWQQVISCCIVKHYILSKLFMNTRSKWRTARFRNGQQHLKRTTCDLSEMTINQVFVAQVELVFDFYFGPLGAGSKVCPS